MSTVDRQPSTDQQTSPALRAPSPNLGEGRYGPLSRYATAPLT